MTSCYHAAFFFNFSTFFLLLFFSLYGLGILAYSNPELASETIQTVGTAPCIEIGSTQGPVPLHGSTDNKRGHKFMPLTNSNS
jgi:hypothetical protein